MTSKCLNTYLHTGRGKFASFERTTHQMHSQSDVHRMKRHNMTTTTESSVKAELMLNELMNEPTHTHSGHSGNSNDAMNNSGDITNEQSAMTQSTDMNTNGKLFTPYSVFR